MDDLPIEFARIRHEEVPQRDGSVAHFVHVPAFIGKHGPFTERFTRDEFMTPGTVAARFDALRRQLQMLPK